jgi:hypothetical protein
MNADVVALVLREVERKSGARKPRRNEGERGSLAAVVENAAMAGNDRTSVYQEITDAIIADLERGGAPSAQPWGSAAGSVPQGMSRGLLKKGERRCSP